MRVHQEYNLEHVSFVFALRLGIYRDRCTGDISSTASYWTGNWILSDMYELLLRFAGHEQ